MDPVTLSIINILGILLSVFIGWLLGRWNSSESIKNKVRFKYIRIIVRLRMLNNQMYFWNMQSRPDVGLARLKDLHWAIGEELDDFKASHELYRKKLSNKCTFNTESLDKIYGNLTITFSMGNDMVDKCIKENSKLLDDIQDEL